MLLLCIIKINLDLISKTWRIIDSIKRIKKIRPKIKLKKKFLNEDKVDFQKLKNQIKFYLKLKLIEKRVKFIWFLKLNLEVRDDEFSLKLIKFLSLQLCRLLKDLKQLRLGKKLCLCLKV